MRKSLQPVLTQPGEAINKRCRRSTRNPPLAGVKILEASMAALGQSVGQATASPVGTRFEQALAL